MKITNKSQARQGVNTLTGVVWLSPGEGRDLELSEAEATAIGRNKLLVVGDVPEEKPVNDDRIAELERQLASKEADITTLHDRIAELELDNEELRKQIPVKASLVAKHRGGGSWSVMDGETEVADKLDKEAAEKFNALSDEDKAAFVADRSKKA